MVRTRMAEGNEDQAKAGQAHVGQTSATGQAQQPETLDQLQRLSMEAAVARIEATAARTEANVVHLDRRASAMRGDVNDVRDRLARLEVQFDQVAGKGFIISTTFVILALLTAVILMQEKLVALLGLAD